jgi:hypothetical protein
VTRTYLVAINYDDGVPPDPISDAADIEDDLVSAGYDVTSVRAWAAPTVIGPIAPVLPAIPPIL